MSSIKQTIIKIIYKKVFTRAKSRLTCQGPVSVSRDLDARVFIKTKPSSPLFFPFDRRSPTLLFASEGEREAALIFAFLGNCFDLDLNVYCVLDLHLFLVRSIPISSFLGFDFSDLMPFMHLSCGSLLFFFLFVGSYGIMVCDFGL